MTDAKMTKIDQISAAARSADPKTANPAWLNTHHDLVFVLVAIERLKTFDIEAYAQGLPMNSLDEDQKTLIIGNLRALYYELVDLVYNEEH